MEKYKMTAYTRKKMHQNELMEKAAERAAKKTESRDVALPKKSNSSIIDNDIIFVETEKDKAFRSAVNAICLQYPAIEKNMFKDFSSVLSFLLKLNIDVQSTKDVSAGAEKALNSLGFTYDRSNLEKIYLNKYFIQKLVVTIFDEYQKIHPEFCAIDTETANICSEEIISIKKKIWHPVFPYLAAKACTQFLVEDDALLLLSGNPDDIRIVLERTNFSLFTRIAMGAIAPEMGKMLQKIYQQYDHYAFEVEQAKNSPFEVLNLEDYPDFEEVQNSPAEMKVQLKESMSVVEEVEDIKPETSSPSNLVILKDCLPIVLLLQENRDLLLKFESTFGLSIKYLTENPEVLEALKKVVDTL